MTTLKELIECSTEERFWSKVNIKSANECWEWIGAISKKGGYGYFWVNKIDKNHLAHRVSYELTKSKIQTGFMIDHICRNRKCVNPNHLREVTAKQNLYENSENISAKTFRTNKCKRGHERNNENTRIYKNKYGYYMRRCILCTKILNKKSSEKRSAKRLAIRKKKPSRGLESGVRGDDL